MLRSITLENFKSFGARQTVALEPISILVGPNNSGKSSFLSIGRFIRNLFVTARGNAPWRALPEAAEQEGGFEFLVHRPATGSGEVTIGWETDAGSYSSSFARDPLNAGQFRTVSEQLKSDGKSAWGEQARPESTPFARFLAAASGLVTPHFDEICGGLIRSVAVQLSPAALRQDAELVPDPHVTRDGSGLAAVAGLWRGAFPERVAELEAFVQACVPELRNVLVRPGPRPGYQRLWLRQDDGEEFDADHVSDGVLCVIALAMIAIQAEPGTVLFIEEPEESIHPPAIHRVVEFLREVVHARRLQCIIATHSRVVIDEFKDEPEAILRFSRTPGGSRVERVADIPALVEALAASTPGDLVESNLFNALPA
ncbi:MAG TPA: AAA family ATPase [Polyangia bacterium]|jgi:predicted ATPase